MHLHFDEDEWETVSEGRPCTSCNGNLRKCDGRCNGMGSIGMRRRAPAEVAKIKAARRLKEEDEILVRAEIIKRSRAATGAPS